MPSLIQSFQNQDFGFLRIVADLWGVELHSVEQDDAENELALALLDSDAMSEVLAALSPQAGSALAALVRAGGRIPWASFTRQFGAVREMGAGKRDREKPYRTPSSASEMLWYRALVCKAFFKTETGPQEFAYIPDDMLTLIGDSEAEAEELPERPVTVELARSAEPPGRGATPGERKHIEPASDRILDDATTMLAALRLGINLEPEPKLLSLLSTAGLLSSPAAVSVSRSSSKNQPGITINADKTRSFLEAPRPEALQLLVNAWEKSELFNELRLIPGLIFEGPWENQPLVTREFLLDLLLQIPATSWWSLNAFVSGIKKEYPDFQRPAGDYDSWFIKRASDGTYLRGFSYWDQVDGALIRFLVTDVLHWLGTADVGRTEQEGPVTAFHRLESPAQSSEENGKIAVASNGRISVPRTVPRAIRYQLSRFCEWDDEKPDAYQYHLTPRSLTRAGEQGLRVDHLLALLGRYADAGTPPVLVKALKRWDANGTEAKAETQVILKVSRPEVLDELRKSKAARFLGEPLGPTSVVIKAGAQRKVMAALVEMGLFADDNTGGSAHGNDPP